MKHTYLKSLLAFFALIGAVGAVNSACVAGGGADPCCSDCSNYWSNCRICRCCDGCCVVCDKVCEFRVFDGCTKCAWSRTWNAPNALATPLRPYYIPRPPQCCWCGGGAAGHGYVAGATWESSGDTNCRNDMNLASTQISPEAAIGFYPVQFERLGKVHNELDVVGPIGGPANGRAAPPAR